MDAIEFLKKEHEEIKGFFSQFEEAGERAYKTKQTIAQKVIEEIKSHSQLEEQIFYPAVREKGDKEIQKKILEGIEEHRVVDFVMGRMQEIDSQEETFDAKFKVLIESVKHHLKEEESKVFPEAKKILKDQLEPLGQQMEALEKQLED